LGEAGLEHPARSVCSAEQLVVSPNSRRVKVTFPGWVVGEKSLPGATLQGAVHGTKHENLWFPRVTGLDVGDDGGRDPKVRHPARGRDGLMDNSELAARHTPRLNRFIATLRDAILDLGGTWKLDRSGASPPTSRSSTMRRSFE